MSSSVRHINLNQITENYIMKLPLLHYIVISAESPSCWSLPRYLFGFRNILLAYVHLVSLYLASRFPTALSTVASLSG